MSLLDYIVMLAVAWNTVSQENIANCFRRTGFGAVHLQCQMDKVVVIKKE
jgi:hypothetical protein